MDDRFWYALSIANRHSILGPAEYRPLQCVFIARPRPLWDGAGFILCEKLGAELEPGATPRAAGDPTSVGHLQKDERRER